MKRNVKASMKPLVWPRMTPGVFHTVSQYRGRVPLERRGVIKISTDQQAIMGEGESKKLILFERMWVFSVPEWTGTIHGYCNIKKHMIMCSAIASRKETVSFDD
jgi:hypothetical protein